MDPTTAPVGKVADYLFTQGGLGIALIVACVVIYVFWKENKEERKKCNELQVQVITLGQEVVRTNMDVARTQEDRNRHISELTQVNTRLGMVIENLANILEAQHTATIKAIEDVKSIAFQERGR